MARRQNKQNEDQVLHLLEHKGDFTVYVEVYGKNGRMIAKLFEEFTSEERELTRKDLHEIEELMINQACIKEEHIANTVMTIRQYGSNEKVN